MDGARRLRVGMMRRRLLPLAVLGALAAGALPATAEAITHSQAARAALRALKPQNQKGRVVVFTLRRRLGAREVVSQANPRARRRTRFRRPGRARWFFWMDLNHGALFAHRSVGLTVDDRTGRVLARNRLRWAPLVNGRLAPFVRTRAAYNGRRLRIFSNLPPPRRRPLARASEFSSYVPGGGVVNGPFGVPRDRFARDCLVTVGDRSEPFAGSYKAIESFAKDMGIRHTKAASSFRGLQVAVDTALARGEPPCNDVFIYLAGHGIGEADGPAGVVVKPEHDLEGNTILNESEVIDPADLRSILVSHPNVEFKVKIMSCYSGRFLPLLEPVANLRVVETSSAADQVSLFDIKGATLVDRDGNETDIPDLSDNPTGADEFTNGNVHGLYEWARMPDVGDGLAEGIRKSVPLGEDEDFAAAVNLTDPQVRYKPPVIGLYIDGRWAGFGGPNEVQYQGIAVNRTGGQYRQNAIGYRHAPSNSPITELQVVVPGGRTIVNQLCPSQLPVTQANGNRLTCSGGSLPLNTNFTLNVRTSPNPSANMGGQISGRQDGVLKGPFPISGP